MKRHHPVCLASLSEKNQCETPEKCLRYIVARYERKAAVAKRRRFKGW